MPSEGEYLFTKMLTKLNYMLKLKRHRKQKTPCKVRAIQLKYIAGLGGGRIYSLLVKEISCVVTNYRRKKMLPGIEKHFRTLLSVDLVFPTTHTHTKLPPCSATGPGSYKN